MNTVINPEVVARRDQYRQAFRSAPYFPHVKIESFFTDEACRRLMREFPSFRREDAVNELGEVGKKAWREQVRELGSSYSEVDDVVQSAEFLRLMSDLTGIPDLLYDPAYIGGGTHENLDGTELDIHVDFNYHPETQWHRRLNLIVFLNEEWRPEWGGCFEVHRDPWDSDSSDYESFPPFFNDAVIFETSERSWHGFNKIQLPAEYRHLSRKSFAIYLYTRERPADEVAPSHATVYVPRPLPTHLVPGATLTERDFREVKTLLAKRDQQIHFLYEREKELSQALAGNVCAVKDEIASGPLDQQGADELRGLLERREQQIRFLEIREKEFSEMLDGLMARNRELEAKVEQAERPLLVGNAELLATPQGLWDDRWAGAVLEIPLRASESLGAVTINGFLPDFFPESREITLSLGSHRQSATVGRGPMEISLPISLAAGSEETLRVETAGTLQPKAVGLSEDPRHLAFQLSSVVVSAS
ncbi:MAG: 2OG-Fe(II) oxygenase [Acidobacteriota bacterium]